MNSVHGILVTANTSLVNQGTSNSRSWISHLRLKRSSIAVINCNKHILLCTKHRDWPVIHLHQGLTWDLVALRGLYLFLYLNLNNQFIHRSWHSYCKQGRNRKLRSNMPPAAWKAGNISLWHHLYTAIMEEKASIYLLAVPHKCKPELTLHHSDAANLKGKALPVPSENLNFLLLSCLWETEMQEEFLYSYLLLHRTAATSSSMNVQHRYHGAGRW